ncbi:MAG: phage head-tail connector protein [Oscillospiraceae bacterium]|nr:phage head-tail connector protein [Candidatus Ruminococcus equi]
MNTAEKICIVKAFIDKEIEVTDEEISAYLLKAEQAIINRRYPIIQDNETVEFPSRYDYLHCELASRYINRKGTEGEISHTESGTSRTYASTNDEDLLSEVIPIVRVRK